MDNEKLLETATTIAVKTNVFFRQYFQFLFQSKRDNLQWLSGLNRFLFNVIDAIHNLPDTISSADISHVKMELSILKSEIEKCDFCFGTYDSTFDEEFRLYVLDLIDLLKDID